jgi:hypothetical protein
MADDCDTFNTSFRTVLETSIELSDITGSNG